MPTKPDPNSPYLASRLQADMGVRMPGTPTSAGKPGVQAADLSFPAPPAPAAAPVGRPAAPATPSPQPPAAAPAAPAAPQPVAPSAPATTTTTVATQQPVAPPLGAAIGSDASGAQQFALSPEGDMRYRQAVVAKRAALGPLPRIFRDPSLPEMPVELGQSSYNPFTGVFVK